MRRCYVAFCTRRSVGFIEPACLLQPNGHRPGLAGWTKSSTTASASWRGVTVPVRGIETMTGKLTTKSMRKRRRRIENDAYAKGARFWRNLKSADRLDYHRPVNKQAARNLSHKDRG
jgi:hypothetical protein